MATQQAWQTLERVRAAHGQSDTNHNEHGGGEMLAQALGWFSIGLGAAQVLAPRTFSRAIGLQPHPIGTTLFGLREIASGIGILRTQKPSEWLTARVAGDVLDLAALGSALP